MTGRLTALTLRQAYAARLRRALEASSGAPTLNELAEEHFPLWRSRLDVAARDLERAGVIVIDRGRLRLVDGREAA